MVWRALGGRGEKGPILCPSAQLVDDRCFPTHEVSLLDMVTGIAYQAQVESQIVDAGNLHGEQLAGFEQVVEIGFGVDSVHVTAIGIDG